MLTVEAKPEHGSPEWVVARHRDAEGRARITASVAGAMFGEHRYLEPADLAVQQLKDEPPSTETTDAMQRGIDLEPGLLSAWARNNGTYVQMTRFMYVHDRFLANLDGVAVDLGMPVEAKTSKDYWTGVLPGDWKWQGVTQRYCFAGDPGPVGWAILDGGLRIHTDFVQEVTEQDLLELEIAGHEWLSHIDQGMIPEAVELHASHVAELNRGQKGRVEIPGDSVFWARRLAEARADAKRAKMLEEEAKDQLALLLAGADEGWHGDRLVVTWKEQEGRTGFDAKRFAADHPDLYTAYVTQGDSFRKFLVKPGAFDGE